MTKKNHIDEIFYHLRRNDNMNHKAIIEAALNNVYNQIIYDTPTKYLENFEFYTKDFSVAIAQDAYDRYYSTLPASIVKLKEPQNGVLAINTLKGTGYKFYPTTEKELRQTEGFESRLIDGENIGYYVKRDTVYYDNMDSDTANYNVRMSLAVDFMGFDDDDEVPLPAGRDYDLKALVKDYILNSSITDLQLQ